jgi:hypothetical protein
LPLSSLLSRACQRTENEQPPALTAVTGDSPVTVGL